MEQFVKEHALGGSDVAEVAEKQAIRPIRLRHGEVVIACSIQPCPERGSRDPNRGLLDKLTDAFCDFIGYHRVGAPFRERHWD